DHSEHLRVPVEELDGQLTAASHATGVSDTGAGRVIGIETRVVDDSGREVAFFVDRFAMRGRIGEEALADPAPRGGVVDVVETPRSHLGTATVTAPTNMTAFAMVSGDYNPIHTSRAGAAFAGVEEPIVHGMWLCAAAEYLTQSIVGTRILGWTYRMFAIVPLGAKIEVRVERVGRVRGGGLALEVTCTADGVVVATASGAVAAPSTAYLYPGQGIQAQGMALDERAVSPAARRTWERADAHTREKLGFSILAVVRDNPRELVANGVRYHHPEGLLNLTQFTQVALATVAAAQTERLADEGALVKGARFAGHSLGEYTALSAYAEVFPLEAVLEIVFQRGSTMHSLVPRDADGASNYRMGALRPNQAGIKADEVEAYVSSISEATGEFLQIVNHNLAGVQYAVAGTIKGLDALAADARAKAKARGGKNPFMFVPGIDVPFHSEVLRPGVPEFRGRLLELVPEDLDVARLVGHYVPNLVARPFALTQDFARSILEVVPSEPVEEILADWDSWAKRPTELARVLLVELLAWQFASPVRWIETQEVLLSSPSEGGLGIEHIVEVGLANSPTLANLATNTLRLPQHAGRHVTVHNARRDEARVLATDTDPAVELTEPDFDVPAAEEPAAEAQAPAQSAAAEQAPAPAAEAAPAGPAPASGGPVDDLHFGATDALTVLLAHASRIRPEQIGATDTTETLTNGVSSRRNQLLMDLGTELELASIDGAADADMTALAATVAKGAPGYKAFGPVLTEAIRVGLGRLLGPSGVRASRIADRVTGTWGLGQGWVSHVTAALFLGTREGASMRGEDLASLG
ncbi:MAG: acyltransferase domain-containing protein, partial [Actinomyces sp.]